MDIQALLCTVRWPGVALLSRFPMLIFRRRLMNRVIINLSFEDGG